MRPETQGGLLELRLHHSHIHHIGISSTETRLSDG